jgi:hypothetical protein
MQNPRIKIINLYLLGTVVARKSVEHDTESPGYSALYVRITNDVGDGFSASGNNYVFI